MNRLETNAEFPHLGVVTQIIVFVTVFVSEFSIPWQKCCVLRQVSFHILWDISGLLPWGKVAQTTKFQQSSFQNRGERKNVKH